MEKLDGAPKLMYTVVEAATALSLSRAFLYRLIRDGEIGTVRVGGARRITAGQLADFVRREESRHGRD